MDQPHTPTRSRRFRGSLRFAAWAAAAVLLVAGGAATLRVALRSPDAPPHADGSILLTAGDADAAALACGEAPISAQDVVVEIPELYELANVALTLTEYAERVPHITWSRSDYYRSVMAHFGPHRGHPLITTLNQQLEGPDAARHYYNFRENSAAYEFVGESITRTTARRYWPDVDAFAENLQLVADFAEVTDFRAFFQEHDATYAEQIDRYRASVDIARMWVWLEQRFPQRYDRYRVVFSPLINGSHSTRRFVTEGETVMFIGGPDIAAVAEPRLREAALARIVFTEIDHNYVNPTSDMHAAAIDSAFADRAAWTDEPDGMYPTPYAVFNEYMTWAVFSLYLRDAHTDAADEAIKAAEQMMRRRGFRRFAAFNRELTALAARTDTQCLPDLFEPMLDWARSLPDSVVTRPT